MISSLRNVTTLILAASLLFSYSGVTTSAIALSADGEPLPTQIRLKAVLSPIGDDIAQQLGALPLIDRLCSIPENSTSELERLRLKSKLTETILIATLQVRDVTARIDREIARLDRIQGFLQTKRDRALRLNSIATGLGLGVIGTVGQVGEMKTNEIPGEITETVGDGLAILLTSLSLYLQTSGKERVQPKPNMLAKILNCPTDKDSEYPALIWKYLNRPPVEPPNSPTRIQSLLLQWRHYKIIDDIKCAKGQNRAAILSNTSPKGIARLSLIGDQAALLADVRAEVFQLDRDLLELLVNTQAL